MTDDMIYETAEGREFCGLLAIISPKYQFFALRAQRHLTWQQAYDRAMVMLPDMPPMAHELLNKAEASKHRG